MARMHSRDKGKSGSTRPDTKEVPGWVSYKPAEVEMLIAKLAKKGETASHIGIVLRDTYGIPSVKALCGKTVTDILKAKELTGKLPEDLTALIRKSIALQKHVTENGQDKTAKRGLQLTISKIKRVTKYYQGTGAVDKDWRFRLDQASFYVD